jgi:hypothetical protein
MFLDVTLMVTKPTDVYSANITHNLNSMAEAAGIYKALWRPDELGIVRASQLIPLLEKGLVMLVKDRKYLETFNPPNGWGSYESLVQFVERYLEACWENPEATVEVSR